MNAHPRNSQPMCGRRVVVVGTSGSGKTTLARELSRRIQVPHIELDALHWEPNWTSTPTDRMRLKVQKAIDDAPDGWTICGNYRAVTDLIWPRADTLVWLDYPMTTVFARVCRRTILRSWRGEILWGGCRENLWMQFFTKESLFLWVINTWRRYRRDYPKILRSDGCRHLHVVRLRSPQEAERWLDRSGPGRAEAAPGRLG